MTEVGIKYNNLCYMCKRHYLNINKGRIRKLLEKLSIPQVSKMTGIPIATLHDNFFRNKSEKTSKRTTQAKPTAIENIDEKYRQHPESSESQAYFERIFKKNGQPENGVKNCPPENTGEVIIRHKGDGKI